MPRVHLFVCDNQRAVGGRPACGDRGDALAQALVNAVLARGAGARVAVTRCACLGRCFDGPVAIEYPRGRWWTGLSPADAVEIAAVLDGAPLPDALADRTLADEEA